MASRIIPDGYYSEEQIAELLNLRVPTLRAYHSQAMDLPPKTKLRNLIIYSKNSFNNWLENHEKITPVVKRKKGGYVKSN